MNGEIQGFLMPYLGQRDSALPVRPPDLVTREQVLGYPTNFNPMSKGNIERLSRRGEQLTRCLVDTYAPEL
jgi:NTE family protein